MIIITIKWHKATARWRGTLGDFKHHNTERILGQPHINIQWNTFHKFLLLHRTPYVKNKRKNHIAKFYITTTTQFFSLIHRNTALKHSQHCNTTNAHVPLQMHCILSWCITSKKKFWCSLYSGGFCFGRYTQEMLIFFMILKSKFLNHKLE